MYSSLVILLSLVEYVHHLKITTSYTTSFPCSDGSYALISGDNLTLQYDYGYNFSQLRCFHLHETRKDRHMFDFESAAGQVFIKDSESRLESYIWTDTGINLTICDINNDTDLGTYEGDVGIGSENELKAIQVKEIFDPPAQVNIFFPDVEEKVDLQEGFGEYIIEASAKSYTTISCSSVRITWKSQSQGTVLFCQAKDKQETTVCPFTLKESNITLGECITLEVYAEQYGVQSEKKAFTVCYEVQEELFGSGPEKLSSSANRTKVIAVVLIGVVTLIVIVTVIALVIFLKNKGKNQERKSVRYSKSCHAVDP